MAFRATSIHVAHNQTQAVHHREDQQCVDKCTAQAESINPQAHFGIAAMTGNLCAIARQTGTLSPQHRATLAEVHFWAIS